MVPSARKVVACILLVCGVAVYSHSQTGPTKEPAASVSGRVTVKGKGLLGVGVIATLIDSNGPIQGGSHRGTTDHDGNYRIANVPAGRYQLDLFAPTFVPENEEVNRTLLITEGETVNDINFALVRGGVITGKITSSDGQPVIAEPVYIAPVSPRHQQVQYYRGHLSTDDRGIYRAFGLRPAKYIVSVGLNEYFLRSKYLRTFFPSVIDEAKATVIEVREGTEIKNVDIVAVRSNVSGYKVSGRIVDGESGKPLPKVPYGLMRTSADGMMGSMHTNAVTNTDGQFTFENVTPGQYSVYIVRDRSDFRAKLTPFEVVDSDVSGLVVKTLRGASLSGVVVFDGKGPDRLPGDLLIHAWVDSNTNYFEDTEPKLIDTNGTFRLAGLTSGTAFLAVTPSNPGTPNIGIVRVERDGIVLPRGFPLQEGEQVENLRVVVKRFTGTIRGQLKFEDGEMPPVSQIWVLVSPVDVELEAPGDTRGVELDPRGRFAIEGLNAGTYEIQVSVIRNGAIDPGQTAKQRVVVADNAMSEITMTVKLRQD